MPRQTDDASMRAGARGQLPPLTGWGQYQFLMVPGPMARSFAAWAKGLPLNGRPGQIHREVETQSQGSWVVRRKTARPPDQVRIPHMKESIVKANLARFTTALMLLATMAMSLGAGMRWWFD